MMTHGAQFIKIKRNFLLILHDKTINNKLTTYMLIGVHTFDTFDFFRLWHLTHSHTLTSHSLTLSLSRLSNEGLGLRRRAARLLLTPAVSLLDGAAMLLLLAPERLRFGTRPVELRVAGAPICCCRRTWRPACPGHSNRGWWRRRAGRAAPTRQ